jgi:hypothetical protein
MHADEQSARVVAEAECLTQSIDDGADARALILNRRGGAGRVFAFGHTPAFIAAPDPRAAHRIGRFDQRVALVPL